MSLIGSIATRFLVVYGFQIAYKIVGVGLNTTKKLRSKAEKIDHDKVQEFLDRQK